MKELSVIMATYRENPAFLHRCVDSVLCQSYRDYEFVIVVEPGEINIDFLRNTALRDSRMKVMENSARVGVAESRNRAIRESRGRYIAILDSDDYCVPYRFEKQIAFMDHNPEISVVGSNMYLVDGDNNIIGERRYPESCNDIKRRFLLTMAIANPTIMIRKRDMEDVGLFNGSLSKAEDFELWLRFLARDKRMYNVQDNLVYYRVPTTHNERRGRVHWRNNYLVRKKYARFIWPSHQRFLSLFFYFCLSHTPDIFLNSLIDLKIIDRVKSVEIKQGTS